MKPHELERPRRWDQPFGGESLADHWIEVALKQTSLDCIDPESFPARLPLLDLLRNDARLIEARMGEIIIRQGDYGDSVFLLCRGLITVMIDSQAALGNRPDNEHPKRSWFEALSQLWHNRSIPEARTISTDGKWTSAPHDPREELILIYDNPAEYIKRVENFTLEPGELFGEIAALRRSARTATVFAREDCQLIEIRWQGIRDLMRFTPELKTRIEELFRKRGRKHLIDQSPLLADVPEDDLNSAVQASRFESHGSDIWNKGLRKWMSDSGGAIAGREEAVIEEGQFLDGVTVIISGFAARISVTSGPSQLTKGYTRPGDLFGFDEVIDAAATGTKPIARSSLRAIGALDLMVIPTENFLRQIVPHLDGKKLEEQRLTNNPSDQLSQGMLDFLVDKRTINGTSAMLINLDRCTDCDDCVKACAVTHDNNPRFVRRGYRHAHLMVANACMQCVDPVCLVGCPTGAIHRTRSTGAVVIHDQTCIGCAVCVESCPYDAIRTVEIRDGKGDLIVDAKTRAPLVKATKCDLCLDQPSGPACQNACPHDALARVDLGNRKSLGDWIRG